MSDAEIEAVRDHWQRDLTRATQTIADVGRERNQLRADLAAANATIAAQSLALATMREALAEVGHPFLSGPNRCWCPESWSGPANHTDACLQAFAALAQPTADTAAVLAGAVLAAAVEVADAAVRLLPHWREMMLTTSADEVLAFGKLVEGYLQADVSRARAALRGGEAAEG